MNTNRLCLTECVVNSDEYLDGLEKISDRERDYSNISLHDSIVSGLTYQASYYSATDKEPGRLGSAHPNIVPYEAFRCKDRDLLFSIGNDHQWTIFSSATRQASSLSDRTFSGDPSRL